MYANNFGTITHCLKIGSVTCKREHTQNLVVAGLYGLSSKMIYV